MDFEQLITFVEVARLGRFSRAGQKLYRSQSAVSTQVRQLEQEYGDRLLDRSGKRASLTPAGSVLFGYADRILKLREESLRAVADQGSRVRGTMIIGANEATCLYVLPDVFAVYTQLYPEVQISIYRNFSYKIVEKLENGSIDAGIVTLPQKSPTLKAHRIFREQLMLMVSWDNPLGLEKSVSIAEIVRQPLLMPKTGHTRQLMDRLFRPYRDELKVRMELPSVGMIKRFVAAGLGVSLISASFAEDYVQAHRARLVPIRDVELWRELGLVYPNNRTLPRPVTSFIATVRQLTRPSSHSAAAGT
ncbi:MAG TPA: LysR family transcriptional regulator [Terriglobales bacterium]|nr:LysR family transcriptional regulator [Terriglobales bacterium]